MLQRDGMNWAVVESEKNVTQYRPLRHTIKKQDSSRSDTSNRDRLRAARKIGSEPRQDAARNAKTSVKTLKKYRMIDSIKRSALVK